jgi:hypothetical protein
MTLVRTELLKLVELPELGTKSSLNHFHFYYINRVYLRFRNIKWLGVSPGWDAGYGSPVKIGTYLYLWVERNKQFL